MNYQIFYNHIKRSEDGESVTKTVVVAYSDIKLKKTTDTTTDTIQPPGGELVNITLEIPNDMRYKDSYKILTAQPDITGGYTPKN